MSGNQEAFQKAMNQGHSSAWEQEWQQAADYYRQALEQFPEHPGALTSLGLALFEQRRYEEALNIYLRAARVAPADPVPLEKAARIYELLSRPADAVKANLQAAELQLKAQEVQKAVQSWQAVLQFQPENLTARTRLGMVYERTGRKPEAMEEYLVAAGILQRAGDLGKAVQLADYAQKLVPESPDARRALAMLRGGQMLPRAGKPSGKGTSFLAPTSRPPETAPALSAPPSGPAMDPVAESRKNALAQLAAILFDQAEDSEPSAGTQRRGLSALARNIPIFSDEAARTRILLHLSQAIESGMQSHDSQAAAELQSAEDAGLNHPALHFMLGLLLNRSDRTRALRYLQKAVKHPDFSLASWLLTAQNYEDAENIGAAAQAYLQALRYADLECVPESQRDELDQIYESLSEGQESADETGLKNTCETISGQLMRADWRNYLREARAGLPASGPGSPPVPLAEMLLESRSSEVVALLSRIRALTAQKKYRTALEEAFFALQYAPTYLPLHIQIADILMQEGRTQPAVSKYLIVVQLYTLRGEAAQAVRLLKRVISLAPADITIRTALIDLLAAQGRVDEAVQQYTDLAEFYYQISDLDKARQTYMAALRLPQQGKSGRATSVSILHKVADIDMQRLDLRQAVKIYEQLRTLAPDDLDARTSLVEINLRLGQDDAALTEMDGFTGYLDSTNRREQALTFLARLVADRPERLDIRKRLADLYQRDGKIPQAVEQLDAIADGLLAQNNRPAAAQVLEKIIALNPSNVNEYRAALARLRA